MTTALVGERLHIDAHPAEVFAPAYFEHGRICRVFVTSHRIVAWSTDAANRPVLVLDEELTSQAPERNRGSLTGEVHVMTERGPISVTKAGGCGCGSALKALGRPVGW